MNPVEFMITIELTEKVREQLDRIVHFKLGDKFYIKSNGEVGKVNKDRDSGDKR